MVEKIFPLTEMTAGVYSGLAEIQPAGLRLSCLYLPAITVQTPLSGSEGMAIRLRDMIQAGSLTATPASTARCLYQAGIGLLPDAVGSPTKTIRRGRYSHSRQPGSLFPHQ